MNFPRIFLSFALLTGVSAFAPLSSPPRRTGALNVNVEDMIGVGPETGYEVWDPLSLGSVSKIISDPHDAVMPDVKWLREAEIKHGRVCMLAFVGTIFACNGITFPGELGGFYYTATPWYDGLASAFSTNAFGMGQLLLGIGLVEGASEPGPFWTGDGDREPGDLGFLPFGDAAKNGRDLKDLQLSELKNGRLAMLAMAAFFSQHQIPGSVPLLSGLTDI